MIKEHFVVYNYLHGLRVVVLEQTFRMLSKGSIIGFLESFVKNNETRPSIRCQIILDLREERNKLNS